MGILRSIIDSIKASSSNKGFEQVKAREMHDKVLDAVKEANEDNQITADEIQDIKTLMSDVEISEIEFGSIKRDVLKNLIKHILEDGKVTEDEMALFKEVKDGLAFEDEDKEQLKADIAKVEEIFKN